MNFAIGSDNKIKWFKENWIALLALVVAFFGGGPGILQIVEHFQPVSLSGSIKFYAPTKSLDPPEDGIVVAITLLNEGSKNLVWRKLSGTLELDGTKINLTPRLVPESLSLNGQGSLQPDLLKQQLISPGNPVNGYLLLTAKSGVLATEKTPSKLSLRFELESGKHVEVQLPFLGVHPIQPGESFPTHSTTFK